MAAAAAASGVVSAKWTSFSSKKQQQLKISSQFLPPRPRLAAAAAADVRRNSLPRWWFLSSSILTTPIPIPIPTLSSRSNTTTRRRRIQVQASAKKQTFSSLDDLLEKSDKPVLVDFYATWCGPCQFMAPVLNQVSISLADTIQVVKIDTEKYPQIADKYNIAALPTFILFKDGKPFDRFEGTLTADQLIQRIEATLKVDTSNIP